MRSYKSVRMKKFTFPDGLIISLFIGVVVILSLISDYFISLFKGINPDYSIQQQITTIISGLFTIVLVLITARYAKSTKDLVDEQVKSRQVASIEKVLENIYSPITIALNQFMINCESLPENRIPEGYNNSFKDFNDVIMNIATKYYHLINQKIINYYNFELWQAWLQYSSNSDIDNYKLLNSRIKMFGDYITKQLNLEKESLNKLQQLGEKMNVNVGQTGCAQNGCTLSTKEWISFLNSEISNLKNEGTQQSNYIFQPMTLFTILATAVITWLLSIANGNAPLELKANLLSLLADFQVLLIILFIVIVSVYIYSLLIYKLNKRKADRLKDIRNNIMNGSLKDTNEIHEKWSNVMLLTYRELLGF